ncbi:MAG: hypothetical protein K6B43_02575 [Treponema sp.]|nr:hypothetical protein [Treponema sp.]
MRTPYKKKVHKLATILLAASAFAFFGCGDEEEEEEKFELGDNVYQFESETLTLTGVNGKSIYLAKVNSSMDTNKTPLKITSSPNVTAPSSSLKASFNLANDDSEDLILPNKRHRVPTEAEIEMAKEFGKLHVATYGKQSRAALQALFSTHTSEQAVDDTADIFVETSSGYVQAPATLRASGTYCNVWVIDDCHTTETASGTKITTAQAKEIQSNFDKIYPIETNVFGTESDKIYTRTFKEAKNGQAVYDQALANMSEEGDYGTKINIVICDLPTGYEGYFAPKDYISCDWETGGIYDYSNCGKFFYVDAAAVNESMKGALLTLAHEFQHMIHFNMKTIQNNVGISTFVDEMCAMVCEDMMASYLGVTNDDTPKQRLPVFNTHYYSVGVDEWFDNGNENQYSYAQAYAFGAWICRQYGGAKLAKAILSNKYGEIDAVREAIKSVAGTSLSDAHLLELYIQVLVFNTTSFTHPTLNKNADETLTYGSGDSQYKYPMSAINLWKLKEALPTYSAANTNTTYYKYDGPKYLSASDTSEIRPKGFTLHEIGTASADSVTLTLSGSPSGSTKYYVLVQ